MCGSVSRLASEERLNLPTSTAASLTAAALSVPGRGSMALGNEPSSSSFEGFSTTTVGALVPCSESDSGLVER